MGIGPLRLHRKQQHAKKAVAEAKAAKPAASAAGSNPPAEQSPSANPPAEQRADDRSDKHRRNGR